MTFVEQTAVHLPATRVCRECRWSECRFRTPKVRAYLIAYREARKRGDDPADYIRDCVRPSRDHREVIEPWIRGRSGDPQASLDIKLSLELARDQGGLSLDAHNAAAIIARPVFFAVVICLKKAQAIIHAAPLLTTLLMRIPLTVNGLSLSQA